MKTNLTELVFILDKSGSMSGLESDTIGGFNAMLKKQKDAPGEAIVTTVLFDNNYELLHDRINIKGVSPITDREYYVEGTTALLDAFGKTIHKIKNAQKHINKEFLPDKVIFVIVTDGMENSSQEYCLNKIKKLVEQQKEKYSWEFIFLGANIDAVSTAESYGIDADRAANYHADEAGTQLNYKAISEAICNLRAEKKLSEKWKEDIDRDFKQRSENKI